jgi:tryptophanyl-tRNA synthetase
MKKTLVSGVQASGKIHIGNYFGAMKQNIELSNSGDFESFIFVADYHALTTLKNGAELSENIYDLVASYMALGLDISKCTFFKQSDVVEPTELSWILSTNVTVPYMMRAHAYKDSEAKDNETNVGILTYPILMAADILMYGADIVPVGSDQKQHIEYTRDIAGYFNRAYNTEYFKLPEDYILPEVATLPGIDGQKMSKSKNNHIPIFATEEEIKKKVMGIVTDSLLPSDKKDTDTNNIYNIHKHFLNAEENIILRNKFENSSIENPYGYGDAKKELLETILNFRKGKIEIYNDLINDKEKIREILNAGAKNAKLVAGKTMSDIKKIVGLSL